MSANSEAPSEEMKRLIRRIAGAATAGEKDEQLRARAARKLNQGLAPHMQIGARRARTYWYGETDEIPSHHMDRARDLAFVQPIDEAINAIAAAEDFLEALRIRLASRCGAHSHHRVPHGAPLYAAAAGEGPEHHHRDPAGLSGLAALRRLIEVVA